MSGHIEDVNTEELEAAEIMFDQLQAGTFYNVQEEAVREMYGPDASVHYIGEEVKS